MPHINPHKFIKSMKSYETAIFFLNHSNSRQILSQPKTVLEEKGISRFANVYNYGGKQPTTAVFLHAIRLHLNGGEAVQSMVQ